MGAQIEAQGARIDAHTARIESQITAVRAEITVVKAEIKAQTSRIDVLQRVIWPLIGLLATTVFGLLYKAVTG